MGLSVPSTYALRVVQSSCAREMVTIFQLCGQNVVAGKTKHGWVRKRDDNHANIRI
jgi:hypothetical protein